MYPQRHPGSAHGYGDYAASKGAIDTLTIGLSLQVAAQGIRVNAVRPGFISSKISESVVTRKVCAIFLIASKEG